MDVEPSRWNELIAAFHASRCRCVLSLTGGGASVIGQLLTVPGGSHTVLEALVPYASASLEDWLGRAPEQYCSETTALAMAVVAYQRALKFNTTNDPEQGEHVGLGGTASLVSSRPKRGRHRAYLAVQTASTTLSTHLDLEKGRRDRAGEDRLVAQLCLVLLARTAGLSSELVPPLDLTPNDSLTYETCVAPALVQDLFARRRALAWSWPDGDIHPIPPEPVGGLLCGSFHPLHDGHRRLRDAAERRLHCRVAYELSLHNVDKPPLDYLSIDRRRAQFPSHPLALTDAPTFLAKSQILPGTVFVVGVDTAARILEPRYYGGDAEMATAMQTIRRQGCRFLTAARTVEGGVQTLDDLPRANSYAGLFEALPVNEFLEDISSTAIRQQQADGS